jgi:hypothetical protein
VVAPFRGVDPAGNFAGFVHGAHQALHVRAIRRAWKQFIPAPLPILSRKRHSMGRKRMIGIDPDLAVEPSRRQFEAVGKRGFFDNPVPSITAPLTILDIAVSQNFIEGIPDRNSPTIPVVTRGDAPRMSGFSSAVLKAGSVPICPATKQISTKAIDKSAEADYDSATEC